MMKENERRKKCRGIHKHERDNIGQLADRKNTAGRIMFYYMKLPSHRQRKQVTTSLQDLPEKQHVDFVLGGFTTVDSSSTKTQESKLLMFYCYANFLL